MLKVDEFDDYEFGGNFKIFKLSDLFPRIPPWLHHNIIELYFLSQLSSGKTTRNNNVTLNMKRIKAGVFE